MLFGYTESCMCDVIKILLKSKDERRSGKGNPLKRDGLKRVFMTPHMTLSISPCFSHCIEAKNYPRTKSFFFCSEAGLRCRELALIGKPCRVRTHLG